MKGKMGCGCFERIASHPAVLEVVSYQMSGHVSSWTQTMAINLLLHNFLPEI